MTRVEWHRQNEHTKAAFERSQRSILKSVLKTKYGLSIDAFEALLIVQKSKCAICQKKSKTKRLAVDHDHVTNRVRGLLCQRCNMMIGFARDNPSVLQNAVRYLSTTLTEEDL